MFINNLVIFLTNKLVCKQTSNLKKQRKQRLHYKDIYSSSSDEMSDGEKDTPVLCQDDIAIGDWVAVIYDDMWYPGKMLKTRFSNLNNNQIYIA